MEEFGEPQLTPIDNTTVTFTAPFGSSPGFMEIPSSPMNPAPAIGNFPSYGSWQIPSPGPDGAVPVPGSGIGSIGKTGGPPPESSAPGIVDFGGSNSIPSYDRGEPYDNYSSGYSGGGGRENSAEKFNYLKGIFDKHITSTDQLPPITIEGMDHTQLGNVEAVAWVLATGQTVTLEGYKKTFDDVVSSKVNWENLLSAAGRPTDAATLAKDKYSLPFFENEINQVFEKQGWPVKLKMDPIKAEGKDTGAIVELDKVNKSGKPTGEGWKYEIDLPPKSK